MKHLAFALLGYSALVMQTLTSESVVRPDLLIVFAATLTLHSRPNTAFAWSAGAGLLADLISAQPIGTRILIFTTATFASGQMIRRAESAGLHLRCLAGLAFVGVTALGLLAACRIDGGGMPDLTAFLLSAAINWLSIVLIAALLRASAWVADHLRQRATGGAMGTPAGLSVN